MAAHSSIGGADYCRKFQISRESGLSDKNGRPYFFEWLAELPDCDPREKRKFETRVNSQGEARNYELFAAIDGILTRVEIEAKELPGGLEKWLCLSLTDGPQDFKIECGKYDGRYSLDIMKRLLHPAFRPELKLRLSPFAFEDKGTKKAVIGLAAMSGVDGQLGAARDQVAAGYNPNLVGCDQPTSQEFKSQTLWDFEPVAKWLWAKLQKDVLPRLVRNPTDQAPIIHGGRYREVDTHPELQPSNEFEDMPF